MGESPVPSISRATIQPSPTAICSDASCVASFSGSAGQQFCSTATSQERTLLRTSSTVFRTASSSMARSSDNRIKSRKNCGSRRNSVPPILAADRKRSRGVAPGSVSGCGIRRIQSSAPRCIAAARIPRLLLKYQYKVGGATPTDSTMSKTEVPAYPCADIRPIAVSSILSRTEASSMMAAGRADFGTPGIAFFPALRLATTT